jgi:hypothetical protein
MTRVAHRREAWIMTHLIEKAIAAASRLIGDERNKIASIILRKIEAEACWDQLFDDPKSPDLLSRLADKATFELQAGKVHKLDLDDL